MTRCFRFLSFCVWVLCVAGRLAFADYTDADASYEKARACYYDLKKSPEKQKHREAWETCIRGFLQVEKEYTGNERAIDASFTVGKLYEELYTSSKNVEDLHLAIEQFNQFAKTHKKHRLADDALYHVGKIRWEGFHQKGQAKSVMWKVIRWYPEGDMAPEAKKFLREMDGVKTGSTRTGALLEVKPKAVALAARAPVVTSVGHEPSAFAKAPADKQTTNHEPQTFTIVIDPGHGGKDTGAVGPKGTMEKNVTLAISKRLATLLRTQLKCQVLLTRDTDTYITLDERNAIANRKKADLFVSIHANAAPTQQPHGIQTYYLNNATDDAAQRLADRENKVAGKSTSDLTKIVSTMLQNAMTDSSRSLAKDVQTAVIGQLGKTYPDIQDQGVRTALFYVLVGAKSPSILVETSFISHPREEQRLRDPQYQTALARAIARGVGQFVAQHAAVVNL